MSKRTSKRLYEELLRSEPLGFVDPLHGLGTFDGYHMKFKEPVEDLKNPWSGDPYLPEWQYKISEMRKLYLKWQKALVKENNQSKSPTRNFVTTASVRKEQKRLIRIGINFGFIHEVSETVWTNFPAEGDGVSRSEERRVGKECH